MAFGFVIAALGTNYKIIFMKIFSFFFLLLFCINANSQIKISAFPTHTGNPNGSWVPIVIGSTNYKTDAATFGWMKMDSAYERNDSIFGTKKNSTQEFFIAALIAGSGIADGNYTDVTVSGTGTVITINNGVVTNAKLANSTISGISLGSNLADLTVGANLQYSSGTTYNGGSAKTISLDLNGTGFVKSTAGTISYDNSVYLTTTSAGLTYQPLDADLTTIAGLTATTDNFLVSVSSAWASRTPAQVRTTLSLVIGTDVQAYDADLTTYAGITPSADVQTMLGSANNAAILSNIGAAASGANVDITSVLLNQTGLVVKGASANALTIKPNETLSAGRTLNLIVNDASRTIDLSGNLTVTAAASVSGTNTGDQSLAAYLTSVTAAATYQPLDGDLTTIAGLTATTDNFLVSVASAWSSRTPSQVRTTLSLGTAALSNTEDFWHFNPTAVKTSNYNIAAFEFVPVNTTSGAVTITLPTAPADKTIVGGNIVILGAGNSLTFAAGGSDVINKAVTTSLTLTALNQSAILQYNAAGAIWYVVSGALFPSNIYTAITGDITISGSGVADISAGVILNADINAGAAIVYSKLSLSNSIVAGDLTAQSVGVAKLTLSAYSFAANNTAGTAAPTELTYENKGIQTYSGTDTWDGTPPSGSSTKQYQWIQIGKRVELWLWLTYATAGTTNTTIDCTFPADLPLPIEPSARTGNGDVLFNSAARVNNATTTTAGTARGGYIIKTGTGAYKITMVTASLSAKNADIYISYITP